MLPLIHSEEGEAMDRGRPLKPLEVSGSTREELESLSRSLSLAAGLVSRAKIVLLCADGFDNKAVAEEVGTSRQTVGKWRERFRTQGLGLYDERRPGKPRSIEDDEVMVLLRKTLDTEPADGSTHWSCRSMADTTGVSKSTVHRVGKGSTVGDRLLHDRRIPLVSATGSCDVGYRVGEVVGKRLGRTILELGGNNAIIVTAHADLDLTLPAILFGSVGTAGQRCTSTRRIIVHESVREELVERLTRAYEGVPVGNPLEAETLMGPLVNSGAVEDLRSAIARVRNEGGEILYGGEPLEGPEFPGGHYVRPCIASAKNSFAIVQEETFAPILYVIGYGEVSSSRKKSVDELVEAMQLHNDVPQGLSSAIFTEHIREAEYFLSHRGSDCGIANVNIGTSGAEIGAAFGGEKETGGGRESGSDAWKAYMRRQTNTVNWSTELPLAQGIEFGS